MAAILFRAWCVNLLITNITQDLDQFHLEVHTDGLVQDYSISRAK